MDISRDPLVGDRVRLAGLVDEDVAPIVEWHGNGAFLRLMDSEPASPKSEAYVRENVLADRDADDAFAFAVRTVESDELVGVCCLSEIEWSNGVAWVSIGIDPGCQGEGYGRETMELALAFAFDEIALHRVQLTVFAYNEPAIGLYERLGFQHEGTHREYLERDGERHDMLLYGLLADEWADREPGYLAD